MKKNNYLTPKVKEFGLSAQGTLCQSPTDFYGYLQDYDVVDDILDDDDFVE